jgi:hypothetical protein
LVQIALPLLVPGEHIAVQVDPSAKEALLQLLAL